MNCAAILLAMSFHSLPGYQTFTPGAGIECGNQDRVGAIVYRNSIGKTSTMLYATRQYEMFDGISIGPFAGIATGYNRGPWAVMAGIKATVFKAEISYLPGYANLPHVLSIGFRF